MFNSASLVTLVFLAISAVGAPIERPATSATLPISVRLNLSGGKLPDIDRARAARIFELWRESEQEVEDHVNHVLATSFPVTNDAVSYVANVGIGSPPTSYELLIDTGSSNTWVGAGKKYVQTSSSTNTGHAVSVNYGSGSFSGTEYEDTVSLASGLTIQKQSIGVASTSQGFSGLDGILGVGPVDLTEGTVTGVNDVPTVSDNLRSQGKIGTEILAISFNPTTSTSIQNGELTFGDTDPSKFTGSIGYTPITTTQPSSGYWGINQFVNYGAKDFLKSTAGIVDTGTTLVLVATDAFDRYKAATGGVEDGSTGLLKITNEQFNNLQSLFFNINGNRYELTPNAQIWPRALNSAIGGTSDGIYLVVADLGMPSGSGMDFINGFTFLERFYTVYDTTNKRVGFATTQNTKATTN